MTEIIDYLAEIDAFQPLGIAKYGYTVDLELYSTGQGFRAYIYYAAPEDKMYKEHIATCSFAFSTNGEYKTWDVLNAEIHERVLAEYDKHNKDFARSELLKALEDRLNGDTEMLVLTPGVPAVEDRGTHTVIETGDGKRIKVGLGALFSD